MMASILNSLCRLICHLTKKLNLTKPNLVMEMRHCLILVKHTSFPKSKIWFKIGFPKFWHIFDKSFFPLANFIVSRNKKQKKKGILLTLKKKRHLAQHGTCSVTFAEIQQHLAIFIIKGFWTIVFIFIVISTTFRPIYPPAFFRCLSNLGTYTELQTTSFIETTGVTCSDSVCHNWVQVINIPVLLLACSQDWTCNH